MPADELIPFLSTLRPADLYPAWSRIDDLEKLGVLSPAEATRWKHDIFGLMLLSELEPDDVVPAVLG